MHGVEWSQESGLPKESGKLETQRRVWLTRQDVTAPRTGPRTPACKNLSTQGQEAEY